MAHLGPPSAGEKNYDCMNLVMIWPSSKLVWTENAREANGSNGFRCLSF